MALGTHFANLADVCESPLASSVISCPIFCNSSAKLYTTTSTPPYLIGGTGSSNGANSAILIILTNLLEYINRNTDKYSKLCHTFILLSMSVWNLFVLCSDYSCKPRFYGLSCC